MSFPLYLRSVCLRARPEVVHGDARWYTNFASCFRRFATIFLPGVPRKFACVSPCGPTTSDLPLLFRVPHPLVLSLRRVGCKGAVFLSGFVPEAQGARDRREGARHNKKSREALGIFLARFNGGCKAITIPPNIEACRPT